MTDHKAHTLTLLPDEVLRTICSYLMQVPKYQRPRSADEDSDDEDADVTEETGTAWARFQRTQYLGVRAVVALSKTSRTLSQHALDALWRSLPGYGPLVFTLPESAYKVETVQCPRALLPWNKPPSQHIVSLHQFLCAIRKQTVDLPPSPLPDPWSTRTSSGSATTLTAYTV